MVNQMNVWDADRISNLSMIMEPCSRFLETGMQVRIGVDGDPCSIYRSVDAMPVATVTSLTRDDTGYVQFEAHDSHTGARWKLDNRSVHPSLTWEIAPESENVFRAAVENHTAPPLPEYRSVTDGLADGLADVRDSVEHLKKIVKNLSYELSNDIIRSHKGGPLEFAEEYAKEFRRVGEDDDEYRGTRTKLRHQSEKVNFSSDDFAALKVGNFSEVSAE